MIFNLAWPLGIFKSSYVLRWMPWDLTDSKSASVQVMWFSAIKSHYMSQCWPGYLSTYGLTWPQWVKLAKELTICALKCQLILCWNHNVLLSMLKSLGYGLLNGVIRLDNGLSAWPPHACHRQCPRCKYWVHSYKFLYRMDKSNSVYLNCPRTCLCQRHLRQYLDE